MGRSIVHCADCGNAIREEDFAKGKASLVDSRTYCSGCRPLTPSASKGLDLRKSSTARLPLASPLTPRRGTPVASGKSRAPLLAAGALAAAGLAALVVFVASGKGSSAPADPGGGRQALAKLATASSRPPTPAEPKRQEEGQPQRPSPIEAPAEPAAAEKIPPPAPRLTDPLDGANFGASADIPIEAQTRDPQGRIVRVEFWQGSTKLGESLDVPYRFTWTGVRPAGVYELKAKSIDRDGLEAVSEGVRITIKPEAEEPKEAPAAEAPAPPAGEAAKEGPAPAGKNPEPKKEVVPQVDPKKVDLAIKKGSQYLVGQVGKIGPAFAKDPTHENKFDELVLWTFVHAGVPESSTGFKHLFKSVTESEIRRTYEVALQAMILEEVDRVRYQERLQQCAQFLVDNQCRNGQWSYGEPPSKDTPTIYGALPVPTGRPAAGAAGERQKPLVVKRLKVTPRRTGPAEGDNSNSQYAALGIRACADAGIDFPEDVLRRARQWFRSSQHPAEGAAGSGVAVGTEASAPPMGWCYASYAARDHKHGSYGSMTAGAIGALAIYDTLLGEDWRKDAGVASGLSWLARNFSVSGNPGPPSEEWAKNDPKCFHLYYLYALERGGVLCRTEWMGRRAWYPEGASVLLAAQGKEGSWNGNPADTCFAILFLKRVTRPLEDVASRDEHNRR